MTEPRRQEPTVREQEREGFRKKTGGEGEGEESGGGREGETERGRQQRERGEMVRGGWRGREAGKDVAPARSGWGRHHAWAW